MLSYKKVRYWRDRLGALVGKRKRTIIALAGLLVAGSIGGQLLYPRDQALPLARLGDSSVTGVSYDELVRRITTTFESSNVTLQAADSTVILPLGHTGATVDAETMARRLIDYPLLQRLIPFSLFFVHPKVVSMDVYYSAEKLQAVADDLAKQLSVDPMNARLAITNGELVATAAKPGRTVRPEDIVEVLSSSTINFSKTTLHIDSEAKSPTIRDSDIEPIRAQAEGAINRHLSIVTTDGAEFVPEPSTIASWIIITTNDQGQMELHVDGDAVAAYASSINDKVQEVPGESRITVVDGIEVGRSDGTKGRVVATAELTSGLEQAVLDDTAPRRLDARMVSVPPELNYSRSYTATQKGLQAYVDYVTHSEDIRISLAQVGGNGWSASSRATEQLPSASTYKLYVSYVLFNQIHEGKLNWGDAMLTTDVSGCFERMIVVSDNACAEKFIAMFGAGNLNTFLYSKGISTATTFVSSTATQTSAGDLEKLLLGIENSTMISGSDRSTLLDKMGRQVYRAGVPAGSAGSVQDKVGFLWDYLHDAAIVRHPKGTYVIAIMTKSSSWSRIAEITRQLEHIMYP